MTYSKKDLGKELMSVLAKGYSIQRISNWAYDLKIDNHQQHSNEISEILYAIFMMEAGPEFEYTREELKLLVELLVHEVENPLQKLNKYNSNREG